MMKYLILGFCLLCSSVQATQDSQTIAAFIRLFSTENDASLHAFVQRNVSPIQVTRYGDKSFYQILKQEIKQHGRLALLTMDARGNGLYYLTVKSARNGLKYELLIQFDEAYPDRIQYYHFGEAKDDSVPIEIRWHEGINAKLV